jgi:hypothetical protein
MSTFQIQVLILQTFIVVVLLLPTSFAAYVFFSLANQPEIGFFEQARRCLGSTIGKVICYSLLGLFGIAGAFATYVLWPTTTTPPQLVDAEIVTVDLKQYSIGTTQTTDASTGDPTKIKALTEVLRTGIPTEDHKCGNGGRMTFRFASGKKLELGILAGHDELYYEYRVYSNDHDGYSMFRVDREQFLAALANISAP